MRMLKAAGSRGQYCRLPKMAIATGDLGSEPLMQCKHNSVRVLDTDSDTDSSESVSVNAPLFS